MAAVALFMVGRLAKFNDIFTSTVPTINNFSNHALRINCLTLFVQLKIQNNILFLYTTGKSKIAEFNLTDKRIAQFCAIGDNIFLIIAQQIRKSLNMP